MRPDELARPFHVLMIEDNPGDARLAMEALRDSQVRITMTVVEDGVEAMELLRREGQHKSASVPDVIILDLNLPRKDGREVLAEAKADERLARIPIVVLTSSRAEQDILRAYDLGANCYITKPVDLEEFLRVVKSVAEFWLTVAELPGMCRP